MSIWGTIEPANKWALTRITDPTAKPSHQLANMYVCEDGYGNARLTATTWTEPGNVAGHQTTVQIVMGLDQMCGLIYVLQEAERRMRQAQAHLNPETGRQRIDVSGWGEPPGTTFVDGMNREEAERAAETGYPYPNTQDGTE